jgi:hypothetical protein
MQLIAVVCGSLESGIHWFKDKYKDDIREYVATHQMFVMRNGDRYKLIHDIRQNIQGIQFDEIVICPTYTDLLSEVKKRLKY